jgi:hypothetical protein
MNINFGDFFSSILFVGPLELRAIIHLVFQTQLLSEIEKSVFLLKKFDFVLFILFGHFGCWINGLFTNQPFFGKVFASFATYYFSKLFKENRIQIIGMNLPASYAPFVNAFINLYIGGWKAISHEITGFLTGHLYFYIHDVLRVRFGTNFLTKPKILENLF